MKMYAFLGKNKYEDPSLNIISSGVEQKFMNETVQIHTN